MCVHMVRLFMLYRDIGSEFTMYLVYGTEKM